ncbi:MAG: ribosome maturation factor RimP [Deltaproteobacteria bacterium]|nr:ribosome maturation factor RimP [Deltaproteobacteria bacterium]
MQCSDIEERIREIIKPLVEAKRISIYDVLFLKKGKSGVLRIYIDKPGGVTVDDCAKVSREINMVLNIEDFIDEPYTLEVSSPGINRLLRTEKHFIHSIGDNIKVHTKEPIGGQRNFSGCLEDVDEGDIIIRSKDEAVYRIPLTAIERAHRVGII